MNRITCIVSKETKKLIDEICKKNHYTHAEFNRRAIDLSLFAIKHKIDEIILDSPVLPMQKINSDELPKKI